MSSYNSLLFLIKKAAVEAVEAKKPTALMFGKVTSTSPLRVTIEQKLNLSEKQLICGMNVIGELAADDEVIILRMQGGQRFLVLDKVAN